MINKAVVRAVSGDAGLVADILARAFYNDPVLRWVISDPNYYREFFAIHSEGLYLQSGLMFLHSSHEGAAMWMPPGVDFQESFSWKTAQVLLTLLLKKGPGPIRRLLQLESMLLRHRPKSDHYYLHAVGACKQGEGIGSALLRAGLDLADQQRMPTYLESTNRLNVPLYQRHGFEIIGEQQLRYGPCVWFMLRQAQLEC